MCMEQSSPAEQYIGKLNSTITEQDLYQNRTLNQSGNLSKNNEDGDNSPDY